MKKIIGIILICIIALSVSIFMKTSNQKITIQEEKEIAIENIEEYGKSRGWIN